MNIRSKINLILSAGLGFGILSACTGSASSQTMEGIWYDQEPDGAVLTVSSDTLKYEHYDYTSKVKYTLEETDGSTAEIHIDEEYWTLIDISYDSTEDVIFAHDLPHTDGDGGYHLHVFRRTEYVPTPEPVYGTRTDSSDPDAMKEFSESLISSLALTVTEPVRNNGDMAPELPSAGSYEYSLIINEDGTGVLSSDFCRDISLSKDQIKELSTLFLESSIPSLNGIDIYTEDMPELTQYYDLSITFADGQVFHSRANGRDVSFIWDSEGYIFHQYLFDLFWAAGYNYATGEFHSTEAMKRIGLAEGERASWSVQTEMIKEERKGEAYEYSVDMKYPVFTSEGDAPEALMKTLEKLSLHYKELAEADLKENYELLAEADESVWKNAERRYAYSFYTPSREKVQKGMFTFWLSEGHACSMGIGKYGYGYYPDHRYAIDEETGKILCLNDLFTDEEELRRALTDALYREYPYEEYTEYFTSDEYQKSLKTALSVSENEGGIGFSPSYDGLMLFFTEELSKDRDYPFTLTLYYDSVQEILNDRYCSIR